MQEILPPGRGRVRPVLRVSTERAFLDVPKRTHAPLAIATQPSPCNPQVVPPTPPKRQPQPKSLSVRLLPPTESATARISRRLSVALGRTTHKLHLIDRLNIHRQQSQQGSLVAKKHLTRHAFLADNKRSILTGVIIILILATTGFVSYDTWQTNNLAKQAFEKNSGDAESALVSSSDRQSGEGKDESALSPSVLADYHVAPNLPRALYIDNLDVAARILPMGVNGDGSMQAPLGIYDAGWYSGSARPGETGAMVLNGHSSGPTRQGLLGRLDSLKVGDEIKLEKGDMSQLKYKVLFIETVALADVNMNKVVLPYGTAQSGLNIYTCTGKWLPEKNTFDHRVIVYTGQIK